MNQCEICRKLAAHQCGGCHSVFYCSKQHQKDDWRKHKKICRPFEVCESEKLGRHIIATRDIKSGEIILEEPPLIWGPSSSTIPVCLGCAKGIDENTSRPCSRCGWPVCSDLCEKAPGHLPECRYTVQRDEKVSVKDFGITHPIYQCITVLRCLYQKQFLPRVWKKIDSLQSHCEERRSTPKYEHEKIAVAEFIRRFFKLGGTFTEDEIMRICGIVMVNSHEVPLTDPSYIAIYSTTSLFEHSCLANCSKSFTNEGRILISAAQPIEKGSHLSICYTDPLWGTLNRRHYLNETKFFWCECPRCLDPTEFGTYFSAIKCSNGTCDGLLLPTKFLELHKPSDWICSKCAATKRSYSIHDILDRIGRDLTDEIQNKDDPDWCKKFICTYEEYLSENHFYLFDVKYSLCHGLGQQSEESRGGLMTLTQDDLVLKEKLCQDLIVLVKILAPAEKRTLGSLFFELHATSAEVTRRRAEAREGSLEVRSALMESRKILLEAIDCLQHEPEVLPEGKIYLQAKQNLKDIDTVLKLRSVHSTTGDSSG